jgi:hypothetical protein
LSAPSSRRVRYSAAGIRATALASASVDPDPWRLSRSARGRQPPAGVGRSAPLTAASRGARWRVGRGTKGCCQELRFESRGRRHAGQPLILGRL